MCFQVFFHCFLSLCNIHLLQKLPHNYSYYYWLLALITSTPHRLTTPNLVVSLHLSTLLIRPIVAVSASQSSYLSPVNFIVLLFNGNFAVFCLMVITNFCYTYSKYSKLYCRNSYAISCITTS